MENCLTDVYLHTFICSHPRAPKLLVVHIHGTEAWSAQRYADLKNMLVNPPMDLSVTTNEAHPQPWSLFIMIYVVHIAMVLQSLHLTIRTLHLSLKQFALPAEDYEEPKKCFQVERGQ